MFTDPACQCEGEWKTIDFFLVSALGLGGPNLGVKSRMTGVGSETEAGNIGQTMVNRQ